MDEIQVAIHPASLKCGVKGPVARKLTTRMQLDYCLKIMETVLNDLKCIGDPIGQQNTCTNIGN